MDDLQDRFRGEVEREMVARLLTSSLAEWMESHHGEAAEMLGHKRMDWDMAAAALGANGVKDQVGQPPTADTARNVEAGGSAPAGGDEAAEAEGLASTVGSD